MQDHRHLPDINQLSILTATILLAYSLTPFIHLPETSLVLRLPFAVFEYGINFSGVVSLLTTVLAALGTDWLLRGHPHFGREPVWPHILLPAFTAWTIGLPLGTLAVGLEWWAVFSMGGILLVLVFIAEYIVVDFQDSRHGLATIGLTAFSFALYFVLTIAVKASSLRLYLLLPAVTIPLTIVCLRTMFLRLGGRWHLAWGFGIVAVVGEVAVGLQYLPLSPQTYGLLLSGLAYGLTRTASAIEEGDAWPDLLVEPVIVTALLWAAAFFLG